MHRKAAGILAAASGDRPSNTTTPASSTPSSKRAASMARPRLQRRARSTLQSSRTGANTKTPAASPIHHVNQIAL